MPIQGPDRLALKVYITRLIYEHACLAFKIWIIGLKTGNIWKMAISKSDKSYLIQRQLNRYDASGYRGLKVKGVFP